MGVNGGRIRLQNQREDTILGVTYNHYPGVPAREPLILNNGVVVKDGFGNVVVTMKPTKKVYAHPNIYVEGNHHQINLGSLNACMWCGSPSTFKLFTSHQHGFNNSNKSALRVVFNKWLKE